jgi:hypothetical protein
MMSRTKTITFTITERQAELTAIALLEAICDIQDNPEKAWLNHSEEQDDRRAVYDLIRGLLPRGYQKPEE